MLVRSPQSAGCSVPLYTFNGEIDLRNAGAVIGRDAMV